MSNNIAGNQFYQQALQAQALQARGAKYATQGQATYAAANAAALSLQNGGGGSLTEPDASVLLVGITALAKGMSPGALKTSVQTALAVSQAALGSALVEQAASGLLGGAIAELLPAGLAVPGLGWVCAAAGAMAEGMALILDTYGARGSTAADVTWYSSSAQACMLSVPLPLVAGPKDPPMFPTLVRVDPAGTSSGGYVSSRAEPVYVDGVQVLETLYAWSGLYGNAPTGYVETCPPVSSSGFQSSVCVTQAQASKAYSDALASLAEELGGQSLALAALRRAVRWAPKLAPYVADPTAGGGAANDGLNDSYWWQKQLLPLAYACAAWSDWDADALAVQWLAMCAWAWRNAPESNGVTPPTLAAAIAQIEDVMPKAEVGVVNPLLEIDPARTFSAAVAAQATGAGSSQVPVSGSGLSVGAWALVVALAASAWVYCRKAVGRRHVHV